ncbi:AraC family transcriptional regulator [Niastella sp. MAH-29]|uniref:AraC family transcriptional regulator n=2 Tax=Chitinophagaceae TaxID=563835 RepID=A0ABS3YVQ2_9BACT|nr:AraC family transcriptional regulator [Niastella soli]
MYKNWCPNKIKYRQHIHDFQEGTLLCIAPHQVITVDEAFKSPKDTQGWAIFFHPDLIHGTQLGRNINNYSYFSYYSGEALYLSDKEKQILGECKLNIEDELCENIDKHSRTLLITALELMLNYCSRFYDRQFITRHAINNDVINEVEQLLQNYFRSQDLIRQGLPTVKYLSEKVNLSPGYLSDLLKKETGMNAQDRIHYYLVEEAKNLLLSSNQSVSELAYSLGFEYPQYFSRLFKSKTGLTPLEFRNNN